MKYALNLANYGRILSATYPQYAQADAMIVETIPEGDISEYRYVEGEYIYDPIPEHDPEPSTPTLENRVDSLEATTDDMILLMAELIGG